MEHAYSSHPAVPSPWRTAAIVAAAVAAVELFVLVVVGVVFGAKLVTDRAEKTIATSQVARPAAAAESVAADRQGG